MLNYFLMQLVGPRRNALKLKEPEKYEFRPKELLCQVIPLSCLYGPKECTVCKRCEHSYLEEHEGLCRLLVESLDCLNMVQ